MTLYARIQNGVVAEIIQPAMDENSNEIPIADRFHPLLVAEMVDVTSISPPPQQSWSATSTNGVWTFTAPEAGA
jgi:hypothetical protein